MEPTPTQRAELAKRIKRERIRQFVTAKAAYTEAQVHSQTWTNAEAGKRIAPHTLVFIVRTLWPETQGDWQLIEPPIEAGEVDLVDVVKEMDGLTDEQRKYMLELIKKDRRDDSEETRQKERGVS